MWVKEPLTLTLSRGERGLTVVFARAAPTCDTAPNSDVEQHGDRLPFPLAPLGERAGVRGMDLMHTSKT